jgi:hypothetical protein
VRTYSRLQSALKLWPDSGLSSSNLHLANFLASANKPIDPMRSKHEYTLPVAAMTQVHTGYRPAFSRNLFSWKEALEPAQGVKAI